MEPTINKTRVRPETFEAIKNEADRECRTIVGQVRYILEQWSARTAGPSQTKLFPQKKK